MVQVRLLLCLVAPLTNGSSVREFKSAQSLLFDLKAVLGYIYSNTGHNGSLLVLQSLVLKNNIIPPLITWTSVPSSVRIYALVLHLEVRLLLLGGRCQVYGCRKGSWGLACWSWPGNRQRARMWADGDFARLHCEGTTDAVSFAFKSSAFWKPG